MSHSALDDFYATARAQISLDRSMFTYTGDDVRAEESRMRQETAEPFDPAFVLRHEWWINHGCPITALYGDDGEMQCGRCCVDFKRQPLEQLSAHVLKRRAEHAAHVLRVMATEDRTMSSGTTTYLQRCHEHPAHFVGECPHVYGTCEHKREASLEVADTGAVSENLHLYDRVLVPDVGPPAFLSRSTAQECTVKTANANPIVTDSMLPLPGERADDRYHKAYCCGNCNYFFDLRILKGHFAPENPECPRCECPISRRLTGE